MIWFHSTALAMANCSVGTIAFLVYIVSVPTMAIAFLIWVHRHTKPKPITIESEVPEQVIPADAGIGGGDIKDVVEVIELETLKPRNASAATETRDFKGDQVYPEDMITAV
jgi:hypothetical protein